MMGERVSKVSKFEGNVVVYMKEERSKRAREKRKWVVGENKCG